MTSAFWISYSLLWFLVLVLGGFSFLLYRQVGLVYLGSRAGVDHGGVAVGETAPVIELRSGPGTRLSRRLWGNGTPTAIVFSLPNCPICDVVATELPTVAARWIGVAAMVWVERDDLATSPTPRFAERDTLIETAYADLDGWARWDVRGTPYVYVVDGDGIIRSRGLVNDGSHVDAVLIAALGSAVTPGPSVSADHALASA